MNIKTFQPDFTEKGKRIDAYLSEQIPELTRSATQLLIQNSQIKINDSVSPTTYWWSYDYNSIISPNEISINTFPHAMHGGLFVKRLVNFSLMEYNGYHYKRRFRSVFL